MYLRNCWYIAGALDDVTDVPVGKVFLGDPAVPFRTVGGSVAAQEDWCCHRHLPLSLGQVVDGHL